MSGYTYTCPDQLCNQTFSHDSMELLEYAFEFHEWLVHDILIKEEMF